MPSGGKLWTINARCTDDVADQWEQILSAAFAPWTVAIPERPHRDAFQGWLRRSRIDDLALVDVKSGPCFGTRTRHQRLDTDGEFVAVMMVQAGAETISQRHIEATMTPGDIVAWDSTNRNRFTVREPLSKRSMLIPWTALDEVGGRAWMTDGVKLDGTAPAARLLTTYLDTLSHVLPGLDSAGVSAARTAALVLLAGALRSENVSSAEIVRPALRASIEQYIERHLLDGAVTPAAIASAHWVSVRTVNRVFRATGHTVCEVIRARRLARAREDLTESDRPISAIAHRWGFSDTSHFSRTFKAHYGSSPTDYRNALSRRRRAS
jgi:AraC-like DNA-binding protein